MDSSSPKRPFNWPAAGIACGLVALLACGLLTALTGAGALAVSRLKSRSAELMPAQAEQVLAEEADGAAAQPSQQAVLADLSGFVEIQVASGAWIPAQEGDVVEAGQRVRTGSLSGAAVNFPDGSRAELLAGSELAVDELNVPDGGARQIRLTQWSGEADHSVAKDSSPDAYYRVDSPAGTGEAKGTKFHVVVTPDQAAYYYVIEGAVAVTHLDVTVLVNAGYFTTVGLDAPPREPLMSVFGEGLVSQVGATWIINGQSFAVSDQTVISGSPRVGDWVIVKGHLLPDGTAAADWIILVNTTPANRFTISGTVEVIGDQVWTIDGQEVAVIAATVIDAEIQMGRQVRVEGLIKPGGRLEALRIENLDAAPGRPFEFTGVIETVVAGPAWVISGVEVQADENTIMEGDLAPGALVQVQGWLREDGTWLASSIRLVEETAGAFSFTGALESKEPWQAGGIAFETRAWTEIDGELEIGELVRVTGRIDEQGVWIAAKIERIVPGQSSLILIGTVLSIDPWIVSGYTLTVTDATVITGDIEVGALVRIEILLLPGGEWQIVSIQALDSFTWFPGCLDVVATVVSIDGSEITFKDWPNLVMAEDVVIEGDLAPNTIVRLQLCFGPDMTIHIVYILIIDTIDIEEPVLDDDRSGKVYVCHKPGHKKGGHTLWISRSALPAHLGHGDYEGKCR